MKPIEIIEQVYKEANARYKTDPGFKRGADEATLRLQRKDPKVMPIWFAIRAISVKEMMDTYKMLGVKMELEDIAGESFYAGVPKPTQADMDFAVKISHEIQTENGLEHYER